MATLEEQPQHVIFFYTYSEAIIILWGCFVIACEPCRLPVIDRVSCIIEQISVPFDRTDIKTSFISINNYCVFNPFTFHYVFFNSMAAKLPYKVGKSHAIIVTSSKY